MRLDYEIINVFLLHLWLVIKFWLIGADFHGIKYYVYSAFSIEILGQAQTGAWHYQSFFKRPPRKT